MRLVRLIDMVLVQKYRLIVATGLVVLGIRVALHMASLQWLLKQLSRDPAAGGHDEKVMENTAYYVDRWLALFPYNPKGNCFARALALFWFARRAGFPVQFNCGVMKRDQHLEGHAWLMLDDREFFEPSPSWRSFTVTVKVPHSSESCNDQSSKST